MVYLRSVYWELRYEFSHRRALARLRRIEKQRERLGATVADMNRHLIRAMPPEYRRDWDARLKIMREFLDPDLDKIEKATGWRFPYGAEREYDRMYPEHRNRTEPEGKRWG